MNGLTDMLKDFFVPLINIYIDKEVEVLDYLVPLFTLDTKSSKKRAADSSVDTHPSVQGGHSCKKLLYVIANHIRLTFVHDTGSFI